MILSDHFVFLHLPKTGGTFVSEALHRVFKTRRTWINSLGSLFQSGHRFRTPYGTFVHTHRWHGTRQEIPSEYRDRPILSCLRHPLDRYVSIFEFGWWKRPEFLKGYQSAIGDFDARYPNFPNLSFREFLTLHHETRLPKTWRDFSNPECPGLHSWQLIRQLTLHPESWTQSHHLDPSRLLRELKGIHFLRTSTLNQDLYAYLKSLNFHDEDLSFILTKQRVLPHGKGRLPDSRWENYYDPELRQLMESKDRQLIDLYETQSRKQQAPMIDTGPKNAP
jgi:hypothetical protein